MRRPIHASVNNNASVSQCKSWLMAPHAVVVFLIGIKGSLCWKRARPTAYWMPVRPAGENAWTATAEGK